MDQSGGTFPKETGQAVDEISRTGGTPLVVAEGREVLGIVHLKDVVKGGIKERFAHLRKMGIKTIMITGDNPLTAASIAAEARERRLRMMHGPIPDQNDRTTTVTGTGFVDGSKVSIAGDL